MHYTAVLPYKEPRSMQVLWNSYILASLIRQRGSATLALTEKARHLLSISLIVLRAISYPATLRNGR